MTSTEEVKKRLLEFCKARDYQIYKSFPIIPKDNDLLFVNASITPFKNLLVSGNSPKNIALIQKCVRAGGGAYSLEEINKSNYCNTFFEMFGCVIFNQNHNEVIAFLFDLLNFINIDKDKFYFTIPFNDAQFKESLLDNGISENKILELSGNDIFWTTWRFGKDSLVGQGITAIYSRSENKISDARKMIEEEDIYIPLLNVICVDKKEENGTIKSLNHIGFDVAIGIERLAAIMQNCNHYQTDIIKPKLLIVESFFKKRCIKISESEIKIITDYLRTAEVIISEGVFPHKNKRGYVLRKIIRSVMEIIFINDKGALDIEELLQEFYVKNNSNEQTEILIQIIKAEKNIFLRNIDKIKNRIYNLKVSEKQIQETYGISPKLLKYIRENN